MLKLLSSSMLVSFALFSNYTQAQDLPKSPIEVPQAFENYFNSADLNSLEKLYSKESIFVVSPGVPLQGPTKIHDALTQFMSSKVPIKLKVRNIYKTTDTALIIFDWTMKGEDKSGNKIDMHGTGADVVHRQADGSWIYAIDNPFGVAH